MSDFLSSLIARSAARTPVVRPVVAPRFAGTTGVHEAPPTLEEVHEIIDAATPAAARHSDATSPVRAHREKPEQRSAAEANDVQPRAPRPAPMAVAIQTDRVPIPAPAVATNRDRSVAEGVACQTPANVERIILRERVVAMTVADAPRPASPQQVTPTPVPSRRDPIVVPQAVDTPSPRRDDERPRERPAADRHPDRAGPRAPVVVSTRPHHSPPPLPTPDVHITIGRVDVRAIVPTTTSGRTTASTRHEPLPLDAYLRGREARRS